jgi:hypothetical protein
MLRVIWSAVLAYLIAVTTIARHTQYPALQADWPGILMPENERIFHFVSATENTVAFFNTSRSICKRFTRPLVS